MLLLCAPMFVDLIAHDARAPKVSYRAWGPLTSPVELNGQWELVWLGADGSAVQPGARRLAPAPRNWSGLEMPGRGRLPPSDVASYRLVIRDLPPGRYTLYIPVTFAAERVFIEGRLIEAHGRIAPRAGTRYDLRSHEISFEAGGAPLALRIDLGAFLHRDNGFVDALVFGAATPTRRWIALEWMRDLLFHSALLLLALNGLVAYLFRRQDRSLALSFAGGAVRHPRLGNSQLRQYSPTGAAGSRLYGCAGAAIHSPRSSSASSSPIRKHCSHARRHARCSVASSRWSPPSS